MPTYNCDICKFSTKIKTHYNRHLNTPKHINNQVKINTNMVIQQKKSIKAPYNLTIFDHFRKKFDPNLTIFNSNNINNNEIHNINKHNNGGKNIYNSKDLDNNMDNSKELDNNIDNSKKLENNIDNSKKLENNIDNSKDLDKYKYKYKNKNLFICELCKKSLSTKGHLKRHLKYNCPKIKINSNFEENKLVKNKEFKNENEILKDLLIEQKEMFNKERKELYSQIDKLLDKVGNTTNIQSNIKNTINLNSYGNEDLSHITDILKKELIKIPYEMIPKMIEAVHFNDNKPENKNISLSNIRDNKVKIYSEKGWVYKDKIETINDLVEGKYFILENFYETNTNNLENNNKINYIKFREYFNSEDKDLVASLKKKCELVLFNNRNNKIIK